MPADRLTTTTRPAADPGVGLDRAAAAPAAARAASPVADPVAVLANAAMAVLAGVEPATVAAHHDLDPADLHDALQTYHAAGMAALHQRSERSWYDLRVQFRDWEAAETIGAAILGPALDQLYTATPTAGSGWWFLRKHPHWRLRLLHTDTAAVDHVLDELTDTGAITAWWPSVYEPETTAFGGAAALPVVHQLMCADSAGVLDYLRHDDPALGRRELSMLLLNGLMAAAGLDAFERGDVFSRVTGLRPAPADADAARITALASSVRRLLSIPHLADSTLFRPGGPGAHATPWLHAFQAAGEQLGHAATHGQLGRGLRAVLVHVVIFHWNRLGVSAANQGLLAHAAATALLPES